MPAGVPYAVQARWILLFMVFSCFFILSHQRINMSVAIICMVNWTAVIRNSSDQCPSKYRLEILEESGEFPWGLDLQAQVLVSYFYGLIPVQFFAEILVERFSPKYVAVIGMMLSSICNLITPVSARWHHGALVCTQITKAVGHALVFPAFSVMLGQWIPTKQLVRFMAYSTSGIPTGAFFTVLLSGVTCIDTEYGWPFIFRFSGAVGIVWCVLWFYLCWDVRFMPVLYTNSGIPESLFPKRHSKIPLKEILTSKPFWGYVSAGIASYWIIAMNIFVLPTYFRTVFNMGVEWNGMLSSFPNVLQAFLYIFSFSLLRRKIGLKTAVRRIITCIGLASFATCVILLTFVKCKKTYGVLLMAIGIGASGCSLAAVSLIAVDMSPNFSGILTGLMNTIGAFAGCGLPLMVGYFMKEKIQIQSWEKIFYASGFVTFISMILFMAYSSSEIQPWNNPCDTEDTLVTLHAGPSRGSTGKNALRRNLYQRQEEEEEEAAVTEDEPKASTSTSQAKLIKRKRSNAAQKSNT